MGIVARQSIKNTIYSYLGVIIGTLYVVFIVPRVFNESPENWGVIQLIMSYVLILLSFAMLGMPNTFIRFFPKFKEERIHEFLFFGLIVVHFGFLIISALFFLLKDVLINTDDQSNNLFVQYFPFVFLILYVEVIFFLLLNYARIFLKTSFPTFLRDPFIKLWTLFLIFLYGYHRITFNNLMFLYFLGYLIQLVIMIGYLIKLKIFKPKPSLYVFKSPYIKEIIYYCLFSILNGGAAILIGRIDIVMIGKLINLEYVAYYSTALLFITVLQVPVRSMNTIVQPILSDLLNQKSNELKPLYQKSVVNLAITTGFIYLLVILNIDEFMNILGEKFGQIKYVVIILMSAKFFESINSLNPSIIVLSKYYKLDIVFQVSLLILAVITNLIFIPKYGIEGAAVSTAISIFSVGIVRAVFIFLKYKLSIVSGKIIYLVLFIIGIFLTFQFFKLDTNIYVSIFIKSAILTIFYVIFLLITKLSTDINNFILNLVTLKFLKKQM